MWCGSLDVGGERQDNLLRYIERKVRHDSSQFLSSHYSVVYMSESCPIHKHERAGFHTRQ